MLVRIRFNLKKKERWELRGLEAVGESEIDGILRDKKGFFCVIYFKKSVKFTF